MSTKPTKSQQNIMFYIQSSFKLLTFHVLPLNFAHFLALEMVSIQP